MLNAYISHNPTNASRHIWILSLSNVTRWPDEGVRLYILSSYLSSLKANTRIVPPTPSKILLPSSVVYNPWKDLAASHTGGSLMCLDTRQDSFGRVIRLSQRPLPTKCNTTLKDEDTHPCLKPDSNAINFCAADRAATRTGTSKSFPTLKPQSSSNFIGRYKYLQLK
jgi:hypothetical protein